MPERKVSYDKIDQKRTPGFVMTAPSIERLFIDSGLAITDSLVTLDLLQSTQRESLTVSAKNLDELLKGWLTAVIVLFQTKKFLARRIVFEKFSANGIQAVMHGETYEPVRHGTVPTFQAEPIASVEFGEKSVPDTQFFVKVKLGIA